MKVHVFIRGNETVDMNSPIKVAYCGYLEVEECDITDVEQCDVWDWCNWSCWARNKPKECEHLLITHCNSDVSYFVNGKWYSHGLHTMANFIECYNRMTTEKGYKHEHYFEGVWPVDYAFEDKHSIQFVTPDNYKEFIK